MTKCRLGYHAVYFGFINGLNKEDSVNSYPKSNEHCAGIRAVNLCGKKQRVN